MDINTSVILATVSSHNKVNGINTINGLLQTVLLWSFYPIYKFIYSSDKCYMITMILQNLKVIERTPSL